MKNVNLTGLYLDMIVLANVFGFNLSSIRPDNSIEPVDIAIDFNCPAISHLDVEEITKTVRKNIVGEVKQVSVKLKYGIVHIYIEF